jgi:L-seryl-tRNA(Ser) seleniumtransferase
MSNPELSELPQIERLLSREESKRWFPLLSRPLVSRLASQTVADFRARLKAGQPVVPLFKEPAASIASQGQSVQHPGGASGKDLLERAVAEELVRRCRIVSRKRVVRVVNATGVVLHTNLGRAPLPETVWRSAARTNTGYTNLELNLDTGKRGGRGGIIPDLLSVLVGCEDALVVNNNAAAVLLALSSLGRDKEVIVSRGQQVQIGGGFRIPEILTLSGATLVEVGTTNITTLDDYRAALTENTALVLVVHSSNFAIRGFTSQPSVRELAASLPDGLPLVVDQGSGTTTEEIPGETKVRDYLRAGADLVCFSGDKVLGGPQAGIVAGKRSLIRTLSRHPLNRTVRPGRVIYTLLEEHLIRRLNGRVSGAAEALLSPSPGALRQRGRRVIKNLDSSRVRLVSAPMATGGGSAPDETFPSTAIEIRDAVKAVAAKAVAAKAVAEKAVAATAVEVLGALRELDPPIIGTLSGGKVLLNLATVFPSELPYLRKALENLLGAPGNR